jgi:ferredoxin-NADP reductase/predicted pyridoxine 5'-phosphate oxidase superfamily flavin-nucleotide-binding protein
MKKIEATDASQTENSPFHAGEKAFQSMVGKREAIESFGQRTIRSYMPEQHREFFAQLPFMIIGSVDSHGWPWASILPGRPGFVASPDPATLTLAASVLHGDPLQHALKPDTPLGLLGIEINTRRRNRLNAHVARVESDRVTLSVDQSFGNCPQYIQQRTVDFIREPGEAATSSAVIESLTSLDEAAKVMIGAADTFFVTSNIVPADRPQVEGVDVSHRGGKPGFVKIEGNTLTVPEYPGNYYFNTLGNFLINPKAGLVFLNFQTGDVLQLTGTVELLDDTDSEIQAFKGAERGWRFTLKRAIRLTDALPFRSELKEYSPNSLMVGDWQQAAATVAAEAQRSTWRPYALERIENETPGIRSFYFKPADNRGLASHKAGQYLTLRIDPDNNGTAQVRTYTVSSAPGSEYYRLSVKREPEGLVSRYLHDQLAVGDVVEAKAPLGDFFIDPAESQPAVLIAGGVGVTPMVSMVEHILNEGLLHRHRRKLTVVHAARTTEQLAFKDRFTQLEEQSDRLLSYHSIVSAPKEYERVGVDFGHSGRVDKQLLGQLLALNDYDFYVCGPSAFMQVVYDALHELGVRDSRVFAEAFGPSSLTRIADESAPTAEVLKEAEKSTIKFSTSQLEAHWSRGDDTLLEVAEQQGLTPDYGCRSGSCGTCVTKLLRGSVAYRSPPTAERSEDEVLICCAVPAEGSPTIELAL